MEAQVSPATPNQAAALRLDVQALEKYAVQIGPLVAYRYAFWEKLRNIAGSYDVDLAEIVGADLVALNEKADDAARAYATMVANLNRGDAELVGRVDGSQLKLCVLPRGVARAGGLGFPWVPLIIIGVAAGTYRAFLSWDAWMTARAAEAMAEQANAANDARKLDLMTKAQSMGPDAVKMLTDQFNAANLAGQGGASNPNSIWSRISQAAADFAQGLARTAGAAAGASVGTALVVLGLLWYFSRKGSL